MKRVFHSGLPNGVFGDPLLVVRLRWERRSLLFDLGDTSRVAAAELLKASHAFVSHTHLDHFVGFDRLLRTRIGDPRPLTVVGPAGILDNVLGKLAGYTWNLVPAYPLGLSVVEVEEDALRRYSFPTDAGFAPRLDEESPFEGVVLSEPSLEVRAALVDHGIPCLAFALREPRRVNVRKDRLDREGLPTGPWLAHLKRAVLDEADDDTPLPVPEGRQGPAADRPLGWLRRRFLLEGKGEKLAFVTDAAGHEENLSRLTELVRGADRLFCEAMFSRDDEERAREFHHLTTRDAGRIAREARVSELVPFHVSPRYEGRQELIMDELRQEFDAVADPPAWPREGTEDDG
jgi:ribonuclease Z